MSFPLSAEASKEEEKKKHKKRKKCSPPWVRSYQTQEQEVQKLLIQWLGNDMQFLLSPYLGITQVLRMLQTQNVPRYEPVTYLFAANNKVYLQSLTRLRSLTLESLTDESKTLFYCGGQFFQAPRHRIKLSSIIPLCYGTHANTTAAAATTNATTLTSPGRSFQTYADKNLYVDEKLERLFVASNFLGQVFVVDFFGNIEQVWTGFKDFSINPGGLCVVNKEVFITDNEADQILVFDLKGKGLRSWGKRGSAPGTFNYPQGVCLLGPHTLCVADSFNCRLQLFTLQGKFLSQITLPFEPVQVIAGSAHTLWIFGETPGCGSSKVIQQWQVA